MFITVSFMLLFSATGYGQIQTYKEPVVVNFVLKNNSLKSIPLVIEGVMKPNLSPMSTSYVSAEVGAKVWYRKKGKNELLLTVTEEMKGTEIIVGTLLNKYKLD